MFSLLNGGKAVSSKVKFSKIYLILGAVPHDGTEFLENFAKVRKDITTAITSSKQGVAGFKVGPDGIYFNACENLNESLKFLEDAIANLGDNPDLQKASIGVNCDSESFYLAEQEKYDMEGPKNLFEAEQMADWYVKLLTDHPLINYIEDPFAEIKGYQLLPEKLEAAELGRKIHIGLKTFYKGSIDTLKEHTEFIEKEEDDEAEGEGDQEQQPSQPAEGEGNAEGEPEQPPADAQPAEGEGEPEAPPEDPNKDKIVVNTVNFSRENYTYFSEITDLNMYGNSMKPERKFGLVLEDSHDTSQAH